MNYNKKINSELYNNWLPYNRNWSLQDINKKSFDLTPILTATIQVSPGLPIYIQRLRIKAPAKHSGGLKRDSG